MNIIDTGLKFNGLVTGNNNPEAIVVHHIEAINATVEDIHSWHKEGNGWAGIGYHYYIRKSGSIYKGRPDNAKGAHVKEFNTNSLGIAFEGNYDTETDMPTAQFNAWCGLKEYLINTYGNMNIYGHREVGNSACPGQYFPLDKVKEAQYISMPVAPSDFDEIYYLEHNADVKSAVEKGDLKSGLEHYMKFGYNENRKYKKEPAKFLITKYLPKDYEGYDGVNIDSIIHKYFENVKCYVRGDSKGVWIETEYIKDEELLNRIANNLNNDGLYFAVQ